MMKPIVILLATVVCLVASDVYSKNITVEPQGVYAEIDTTRANETIRMLQGSKSEKEQAFSEIKAHPENYAPPVFYVLSNVVFKEDKEEALFWFYAGQLRARYDANRCVERSAKSAVGALNDQFGPMINKYAFQNLRLLKETIPKVVKWDEETPHKYDHRWINLHGMGAFGSGKQVKLSEPEAEWESIAKQTRDDYLAGFQEAMKSMSE